MDLSPLVAAVREAAATNTWSRAVLLAREGLVVGEQLDDDEVVLSVLTKPTARKVWLWPEDEDWSCECGGEACVHAAAAVIALNKARSSGQELPRPRRAATLRYVLERGQGGLEVVPHVASPGGLRAVKEGFRSSGAVLRDEDLKVERALLAGSGRLPEKVWRQVLIWWADASADVWLDGEKLRVDTEPLLPVVLVKEHGAGFRVSLHRPKEVTESFGGGLVRVGDTLKPMSDGGLTPLQRSTLARGVIYEGADIARLVADELPRLRRAVTVKVMTNQLPEGLRVPPRMELRLTPGDGHLEVFARVVYGDPPVAAVEQGQLKLLRRGALPIRDQPAERRLVQRADAELAIPIGRSWWLSDEGAIDFAANALPRFTGTVVGDPGRWRVRDEPVQIWLEDGQGGAGLRLRTDADRAGLQRSWQAGASLVPLTGGGFAPLPADFLERWGHLLGDLLAAADEDGELPLHAIGPAAELAEGLDRPPPPALDGLRPLLAGFEGLPDAELPAGVRAQLRPYQHAGYRWLCFLQDAQLGGILADDMGLGKTLQALCALVRAGGTSLVVAPTSVLRSWQGEAARFAPELKTCVFHGPKRELDEDADLVITSYALLRLDERLRRPWTYVVLDEAQAIKNPGSQTAQAAFALEAEHRLSLTGTPVENRLDELWSQLHFLMPGFLGGRTSFQERYVKPIEQGDRKAAAALRARIKPFVLRRLKGDVAKDLPPRTEVVLRCPMTEAQQDAYAAIRAAGHARVLEALGAKRTMEVLEHLLRLRQAACHPALLPGREDRSIEASGKLALLVEQLELVLAEGHKALVFSQWTGMLDLVQEALTLRRIEHQRLDGSSRDRQGLIERFQADDGPPVFLISLKAGGTGLTLTAADYVFHCDPWWNPAVEDQATDRAHRIGQTRPVVSVKLVAEDTVEERILDLQQAKRELARAALGDAGAAASLRREDLEALLA